MRPLRALIAACLFPALASGRFQGVFFENVEPEYTTEIRTESK